MKSIRTFTVKPSLPPNLQPLLRLAHNLRWSWDHAEIDLFRRLDRDLWETCNRNPVKLLGCVQQSVLEAAAKDDSFLAHMKGVVDKLDSYLTGEGTWYRRHHGKEEDMLVAYFSAEFGITECLSIFAGGLGVLAGDHLKASSDLGLPLVGVGLLYQQGYFRQYLNAAGWQQEAFEENDFHTWPIERIPNVSVSIDLPDGKVQVNVWHVNVGRLQLYLLDTNLPSNRPEHRKLTAQLYGGDLEMRMRQEILLGVGGYRALEALRLKPTVYHMNEGHSAFLGLEHVLRLMETENLSFSEARVLASSSLPTLETLAAVDLLRQHFPDLRIRFVNVVDLMTLQPTSEHPHGLPDAEFNSMFTLDKPIIFAYHGYPWLIHRLTYRRHNHDNLHVRGYKEEGTTTTPFDMTVLNEMDRFHLASDVVDRVPRLQPVGAHFKQILRDKLIDHKEYICRVGDDMPEIKNWKWPY